MWTRCGWRWKEGHQSRGQQLWMRGDRVEVKKRSKYGEEDDSGAHGGCWLAGPIGICGMNEKRWSGGERSGDWV